MSVVLLDPGKNLRGDLGSDPGLPLSVRTPIPLGHRGGHRGGVPGVKGNQDDISNI